MSSQNNHHYISQELLFLRIHMQFVTVQLTQLSKGALEVVHVFDSLSKGGQYLLAMGLDLGVAHDGGGRGQVSKVIKESLGPGVDNEEPGFASSLFHVHFAPQAQDGRLLLSKRGYQSSLIVRVWG
uniref:Uncharacterized protein n=1 Tax=Prolemur simus TaxID=1328070 RepID=A0A8C8YCZ9_PROSS